MRIEFPENVWLRADGPKPRERKVDLHFKDGHEAVGIWNGFQWVGQHRMPFSMGEQPTYFLVRAEFNEDNIA